jgi:hypothetical protein
VLETRREIWVYSGRHSPKDSALCPSSPSSPRSSFSARTSPRSGTTRRERKAAQKAHAKKNRKYKPRPVYDDKIEYEEAYRVLLASATDRDAPTATKRQRAVFRHYEGDPDNPFFRNKGDREAWLRQLLAERRAEREARTAQTEDRKRTGFTWGEGSAPSIGPTAAMKKTSGRPTARTCSASSPRPPRSRPGISAAGWPRIRARCSGRS